MKPALLVLVSCAAFAQTPTFEVADVHVSKPGTSPDGGLLGARLELHGFTMLNLITYAYGIEGEMVFGGPAWLDAERFDVIAKASRNTTDEGSKLMLRTLLADRFKLTVHTEPKPLPAYVLTVGKKLLIKEGSGEESDCQPKIERPWLAFACKNLTMEEFAERVHQWANGYVEHPVVDQTGLKGKYDFTLRWTGRGALASTPDGVSLFDAVSKQMGLKLEASRQPLPAMVVDSVEKTPSSNPPGTIEKLRIDATEFEVADVKPSRPDARQNGRILPTGRIDIEAFPLRDMIKFAYDVRDDAALVGPKWMESARFDLHANAGTAVSIDALRVMMKSLLADRFKLTTHTEEQPVATYVLIAGKRPKVEASKGSGRAGCGRSVPNGMIVLECKNMTMTRFAEEIRQAAGGYLGDHPMVDGTELAGEYDFNLTWTPKGALSNGLNKPPEAAGGTAAVAADPGGLTVFEAIDRQLGLKVEVQKKPMPVVLVDRVNQVPTEN